MPIDFGKMFNDAVKGVSDFVDQAGKDITKALDQNGDGQLDISDFHVFQAKNQAVQKENQIKADLERLKPMFQEDFKEDEFVLPKMICVAEIDKAHAESAACKGSVGYKTIMDDISMVTIFRNFIDSLGLTFYPDLDNGVYYVDPCDRDHYIALDDYFSFMKMQRVAELQRIAQSLGAKHFKVISRERTEAMSSSSIDAAASVKMAGQGGGAGYSHADSNSSMTSMSIEAEMRFPGHAPIRPELNYLKKEINVINLIEMRMDPLSPLEHQHFSIEMINSSGIKVKDAAKIDAMIKAVKISANTSIMSEAQNEARRILEYDIEF